jgi:signal transduction histidine kinase
LLLSTSRASSILPEDGGTKTSSKKWQLTVASASALAAGAAAGCAAGLTGLSQLEVSSDNLIVSTRSAGTVLAAFAAYLFLRRLRRTEAVVDVVLTASLTLFALVNVTLTMIVASSDTAVHVPIAVGAGLFVAAGFALAAFVPDRSLDDPSRSAERLFAWGTAGVLASVAAFALIVGLMAPGDAVAAGDLLAAALWVATAVGFVRRSGSGQQAAILWLAVAAAVSAVAHLSDAMVPWTDAAQVSAGEVIQILGLVALLVAGLRDFEWDHAVRAESAVLDERRRMARELHDGLAQELAFISTETRRMAGDGAAEHLAKAAERALEESRSAILALTRPANEPLERTIAEAAHTVADRAGVEVLVAVRPGLDAPADIRQALLRILREAMTNAIRHGQAKTIRVSLDGPGPLVLVVGDDGEGFDQAAAKRPDSLGLRSMTERAENVGGRLTIESVLGSGTNVAVVIP